MTQVTAFNWHPNAKLFAGVGDVARPKSAAAKPFKHIPARPTFDALCALVKAVSNGGSFCVSDMPMPSHLEVASGRFLTLTGGSSGQPKIIQRTHLSWITSFKINADLFSFNTTDSVAVFGTLDHSLSLYGLLEALYLGLDAHVLADIPHQTQCSILARQKISVLYATPTQLRLLAQRSLGMVLPDVRLILCGGGMLDQNTRMLAQSLCPNAALHVFYGAAETSFVTIADNETPAGSVGRAYPGVTLEIRDTENKPTSEIGEVWVHSPYIFNNYLTDQSDAMRHPDGFVSVGEMGRLDAMGNLWLKGRKSRMVTIADQNVFPEGIETLIAEQLGVGACVVIPIPDQTRGHRLVAVLEGAQDAQLAQTIKETCHSKFGALMAPHKVLFHPGLPLLASGKVDMKTLSTWVEAHQ
ncbi:MAG: AMP-binding protein [Sulfitobacter sp.]